MLRYTFVLAGLLSLAGFFAGGCHSCSSCHDYDPPVANCQPGSGCAGGSCNGACNCGGDHSNGAYAQPTQAAPANTVPANAMKQQNNQPQRTTQQSQPMTNAYPQQ